METKESVTKFVYKVHFRLWLRLILVKPQLFLALLLSCGRHCWSPNPKPAFHPFSSKPIAANFLGVFTCSHSVKLSSGDECWLVKGNHHTPAVVDLATSNWLSLYMTCNPGSWKEGRNLLGWKQRLARALFCNKKEMQKEKMSLRC